jgi:hypothetical protein
MTTTSSTQAETDVRNLLECFRKNTRFPHLDYEIKERADGPYLIIYFAEPSERLFHALTEAFGSLAETNPFRGRATIKRREADVTKRLGLPETLLLRTVLAENLTASSSTLGSEFLSRYIRSVFGAEEQVTAQSNHIVFGRRGSGKSSLLLYGLHMLKAENIPYVWVPMQTYDGRSDFGAVIDVFIEVLRQVKGLDQAPVEIDTIIAQLERLLDADDNEKQFDRLVPKIRRTLAPVSHHHGRLVLFLDDIHVVGDTLQPRLLSKLYAVSRDNRVFLKISGIEQLTNNWDPAARKGLETPGDAQVIALDYNLTMPGKSLTHIESILNAHATYCGLPDITYICGGGVLQRLVWVAAGVPRDALSIFSTAIARATLKDQRRVSITSVNEAASETADEKLSDVARDASGKLREVESTFDIVRRFCVDEKKTNAFLVEIETNNPVFKALKELIALRLLHVLHEGVTPHEAGRRYIALMLDYGFYVGIRAARSVELFQKEPKPISAKSLRRLPIFPLARAIVSQGSRWGQTVDSPAAITEPPKLTK